MTAQPASVTFAATGSNTGGSGPASGRLAAAVQHGCTVLPVAGNSHFQVYFQDEPDFTVGDFPGAGPAYCGGA